MVGDLERRLVELRFIDGIEKVEHVPYPTGDQFWVRFNLPLDLERLEALVEKHGYQLFRFANLPSKLPRGLAEMLWDGVTHVITKKISGWAKFTSSFGFEPEGIAKIARDLHSQHQIFMATEEDGVQLLYEYLRLKYVLPAPPPPKPATPAKPPVPAATVARPPAPQPAAPPPPAPTPANTPPQAKPSTTQQPKTQAQTLPVAGNQTAAKKETANQPTN